MKYRIIGILLFVLLIFINGCLESNDEKPNEEPNQKPIADISGINGRGILGFEISFIVTAEDPDGEVILFEWDFDGDGIYDWNSTTTGNTTYLYGMDGKFNATLRITDNDGDFSLFWKEIDITGRLPPSSFIGLESSIQDGDVIDGIVNITGIVWIESYDNISSMSYSLIQGIWIPISTINVTIDDETKECRWNITMDTSDYANDIYDLIFSIDLEQWGSHRYDIHYISINN